MSENTICGNLGTKGHGKSYHAMMRIKQFPRYVVFDTIHQYDPKKEMLPLAVTMKAAGGYMLRMRDALNFAMIIQPSFNEVTRSTQLEWLIRIAFHVGNCAILVDEIDQFCNSHTFMKLLPKEDADGNPTKCYLKHLVDCGRHAEVSLVWTARRFANVHPDLRAQTDEYAIFRMDEPIEIDTVRRTIPGAADLVTTLPKRHAVIWKRGSDVLEHWPKVDSDEK
jgi:hypothetical protein